MNWYARRSAKIRPTAPALSHAEATRRRVRAGVTEGLGRGEHTFARRFRHQLRSAKSLGRTPYGDARTFGNVA